MREYILAKVISLIDFFYTYNQQHIVPDQMIRERASYFEVRF